MSKVTELTCIVCPKGCHLCVDEALNVTGNTCKRGEIYGKQEVTNPQRVVTTTVKVNDPFIKTLPVKTNGSVPKAKVMDVVKEIKKLTVKKPIKLGDVVLKDVLGLGVDVIAASTIE